MGLFQNSTIIVFVFSLVSKISWNLQYYFNIGPKEIENNAYTVCKILDGQQRVLW